MTLAKPTIMIFDMDGTAVRHINPRLLHVLELLDSWSYRVAKFWSWVFERGAKGPIVPEWHQESKKKPRLLVHRAIHKFRRKPVEQIVEPGPGLYELLTLLQQNNIPLALISNGLGAGYGHEILETFELTSFFGATVFREDIKKSKPHPESLLLALKRMNIEPEAHDVIWYIGDRHKDVVAALAAQSHVAARVVPVAYGLHAAVAVLEKHLSPEHIMMSFYDMFDRLKPMFQDKLPLASEGETLNDNNNASLRATIGSEAIHSLMPSPRKRGSFKD